MTKRWPLLQKSKGELLSDGAKIQPNRLEMWGHAK